MATQQKFKVSWWIHGAGRITRGYDIVEADELDESTVLAIIEKDLSLVHGTSKYDIREEPKRSQLKLPNFYEKHSALSLEARHSEISNFGILKITKSRLLEASQ